MFSRLRLFTAVALILVVPGFARAADPKADAPSVLVRVQSVNDLLKTVGYIGTLLPEELREPVKQVTGLVKGLIDEKKGLEGLDVKNPIGLYVTVRAEEPADSPAVVLVPVADRDTLLNALQTRIGLDVKEKDGLYEMAVPGAPTPIYFRFANGYAYVGTRSENIDPKALPKPADVLAGKAKQLFSATVHLDRLPKSMKDAAFEAIASLEGVLAQGRNQPPAPGETEAMKAFGNEATDQLIRTLRSVVVDGEQVALHLSVDPKTEAFALAFEMTGLKGSKLARDLKSIAENTSVVAGAIGAVDANAAANISVALAPGLKKVLGPAVGDLIERAQKEAGGSGEKAVFEPLLKALAPSLKSGELDAGVALHGPDKGDHYTAVLGLKLAEGKKVEDAFRDLVKKKQLPPELAGLVVLDAERSNGTAFHLIKVSEHLDEQAHNVFGKSDAYLSFRGDMLVVGFGPQGKEAVQKALSSAPADVGVVRFKVPAARLATKEQVKKVFGDQAPARDAIEFAITGGDSLKVKIGVQGNAVRLLAEIFAAERGKKD